MTPSNSNATCPACGSRGRLLGPETLTAQLKEVALRRSGDLGGHRFCANGECEVVYFGDEGTSLFTTEDLILPVFQKSTDRERFVCYCFRHRVGDLLDEVGSHGSSVVPSAIKAKCKAGLDQCETKNPQGVCCLGNVLSVVKHGQRSPRFTAQNPREGRPLQGPEKTMEAENQSHDCCSPQSEGARMADDADSQVAQGRSNPERAGLVSAGGALAAAVLSSACCWLPLALISVGASAAGVGGFFEAYRVPFLVAAAGLLGAGFYYVYMREPKCAPGEACAVPNPRLQKFNRITLWVATAFIVAFAAFPQYVGVLLAEPEEDYASAPSSDPPPAGAQGPAPLQLERTYSLAGMTCEGCSIHAKKAFEGVSGVGSATIDYSTKSATLVLNSEVPDGAFEKPLAEYGYRITARDGRSLAPAATQPEVSK